MRHYSITCESSDLPSLAFRKAFGRNRPRTLEGGKGGSAPAAPDPYATAAATTQEQDQTAAYNKALGATNFSNPFGSESTTQTGTDPNTGAPIYGTSIGVNPQLGSSIQSLLGQVGQSGQISSNVLNGLMGLSGSLNPQAAQSAQQQGQQAAYAAQTQYLDPQFAQGQESLTSQLANQGLTPGSDAYNNAMLNFNNQKQQAYSNAANTSELTGSQIGTQNYQNQLAGISSQAGLLGQEEGIGQTPYSNLGSLASLIPGYAGTGSASAQSPDIGSYINNSYQGQLANYNAGVSSSNSTDSAIAGLGSAALLAAFL